MEIETCFPCILTTGIKETEGKRREPAGGEGCSVFQVMGMIEGFFGFDILDFGIFGGRKIWHAFFLGGLI